MSAQAYFILDEFLINGHVTETSKAQVFKAVAEQDLLEVCTHIRACIIRFAVHLIELLYRCSINVSYPSSKHLVIRLL